MKTRLELSLCVPSSALDSWKLTWETRCVEIPGFEGVSEFVFGLHPSALETSGVFMSLLYENADYSDVRSCGWERAVGQLLKPAWGELSLRACPLEPQWPNHFHVRDRVFLQSFMSSFPFWTENTKNCQFKILSC
ncbi:hypothetical protein PHYPO_G00093290 [Pangasianodon hypophthalmus]|uniref:Uncharacterized protein n=1 Tax=Pangasianodon hypophthalmus TaxID=310915 RepID=A0A5N5LAT4_PANHP|nr:hypothetical protein PHYPO_G00093290 [Pangasianodon hypophthalmus]